MRDDCIPRTRRVQTHSKFNASASECRRFQLENARLRFRRSKAKLAGLIIKLTIGIIQKLTTKSLVSLNFIRNTHSGVQYTRCSLICTKKKNSDAWIVGPSFNVLHSTSSSPLIRTFDLFFWSVNKNFKVRNPTSQHKAAGVLNEP